MNRAMRLFVFLLLFVIPAFGKSHGFSLSQSSHPSPYRLFADYETVHYIGMSDPLLGNKLEMEIKKQVLKALPDDMAIIVYTTRKSKDHESSLREFIYDLKPKSLVLIVPTEDSGYGQNWGRDVLPLVAVTESGAPLLINNLSHYNFNPDRDFIRIFNNPSVSTAVAFEGGNILANSLGDCFTVNGNLDRDIKDSFFFQWLGCRQLFRFPVEISSVAHADERLKWINDNTVLTDSPTYKQFLQTHGLRVISLPRPVFSLQSYLNALQVNEIMFVPIFDQPTDQVAIETYESLGFKVVPINMKNWRAPGLLHCLFMTYPALAPGSVPQP